MKMVLEPGRYVVAVSGGVDSMALLHMLWQQSQSSVISNRLLVSDHKKQITENNVHFIVAHFDHGIRHNSDEDRLLVQKTAKHLGMNFVYDLGNLGSDASEATARKARYEFLHKVRLASKARAVVTAHHQDDVLETAILNLLRGTGRRGLSSLRSTDVIVRPLLHVPKNELIEYAKNNGLEWNEDITNIDLRYKRNYVRHVLLPKLSAQDRDRFLKIINDMHLHNDEIEQILINHLHMQPALNKLNRHVFIMLPHKVATEVMAAWLRKHNIKDFDKKTIERLVAVCKTLHAGQIVDVDKRFVIKIGRNDVALHQKDQFEA